MMTPEWITLTLAAGDYVHHVQVKWIAWFRDNDYGETSVQFSDGRTILWVKETPEEIAMLLGIKRETE